MSGVLEAAMAAAGRAATERQRVVGSADLERTLARRLSGAAHFGESLSRGGFRVIAECKRRSPSKGILRDTYDPATIAAGYEEAGAAAISVLTEPTFFDGSLEHLRLVREAVALPVLRKDFISLEYQLLEAAAFGADAALLIVAALDDRVLERLLGAAGDFGLETLVEAHDAEEISRAVQAGAKIVGVNSRNLRTLDVNPARLEDLAARIPSGTTAVAESGLRTTEDLVRLQAARYDAFLVGERLMTSPDPAAALRVLLGRPTTAGPS